MRRGSNVFAQDESPMRDIPKSSTPKSSTPKATDRSPKRAKSVVGAMAPWLAGTEGDTGEDTLADVFREKMKVR